MSTLYYYKSPNTLTNQGRHNLPCSGALELWEVLTWPSEGIWWAPHRCSLLGLLLLLCRCCFECTRTVWLIVDFLASSELFVLADVFIHLLIALSNSTLSLLLSSYTKLMQGRWWVVIWFRIRWKVSCLKHIDRWLGTSAKITNFSNKIPQVLFLITFKNWL